MLQQYYGTIDSSRYSPPVRRSKSGSVQIFAGLGSLSRRSSTHSSRSSRSLSVPTIRRETERVRVNVSGKKYEFSAIELAKYPGSLLANPGLSGKYYDHEAKEYFFDRSRIAFDSIHTFYKSNGTQLSIPENFPELLMVDELDFFGLYSYLVRSEKDYLPKPTGSVKKETVPKDLLQRKVWEVLERPESSLLAKVVTSFTLLVILFSIVILCAETLPFVRLNANSTNYTSANNNTTKSEQESWRDALFIAETCCIVFFTSELFTRFVVSPIKSKFLYSALNIIDLIAIIPYYVALVLEYKASGGTGVAVLRIFRLSRAFRILKVSRYVTGMEVLGQTMRNAVSDLWMISFLTIIGMTLFASCVYYFEQLWDPSTAFDSIPVTLWWAIVTISTLGYGDMAPKTFMGRVTGAMCAVSGVLLIAPLLPIIYERWERFYLLDQQAKLIGAAIKRKKDIEGDEKSDDRTPTSTRRYSGHKDKEVEKDGRQRASSSPDDSEGKGKTRRRSKSITVAEAGVKDFDNPDFDIKKDDDVIWAHIRTASLKRMQSQGSFKLPKQRSMSESISEHPDDGIIEVQVNTNKDESAPKGRSSSKDESTSEDGSSSEDESTTNESTVKGSHRDEASARVHGATGGKRRADSSTSKAK